MNVHLPTSIQDITPKELQQRGIKGITFDIENVLTDYKGRELLGGSGLVINSLHQDGIAVALATNSQDSFQVEAVRNELALDIPTYAPTELRRNKLYPDMFVAAADELGLEPSEMAHVDDQLKSFLGAVKAGFGAGFWMKPVGDHQHVGVKAVRPAESIVSMAIRTKKSLRKLTADPFGLTD